MPKSNWTVFRGSDAAEPRRVGPGDIVRPWIAAGPFFKDVSTEVFGASMFERPTSNNGEVILRKYLQEACEILSRTPVESAQVAFLGQTLPYELIRREEPMLAWGRYNRMNSLVGAFLSTRITPDRPGRTRLRFRQHLYNLNLIAVNGQVQFESWGRVNADPRGEQAFEFDLTLKEGENVLTVGAFRLARMTSGSILLEPVDAALTVRPPLRDLPASVDRRAVEKALASVFLPRETFYPQDPLRVACDDPPSLDADLRCEVLRNGKALRSQTRPLKPGEVALGTGADIGDGGCEIRVTLSSSGQTLGERSFEALILTPTPPMRGADRYDERRRYALEHHASGNDIWAQVARCALGNPERIDRDAVWETCYQIRERHDCADFVIQALLRLMYMDRGKDRIDPHVRALIKDTCLGFKYWVDEPGEDVMVTGTENHRMLFHVAEFLAGTLWPTEVFPNSGMNGLQHAAKSRQYMMEWLNQRGRFGFDEWHSNSYYPITVAPILNVLDFVHASENRLRLQARQVLTMAFFNLAADGFRGVFGATHGRTYVRYLKNPDHDGTAGMMWVLFGEGSLHSNAMGTVSLATSAYRPPEVLSDIAADRTTVSLSRQRQGLAPGGSANFIVYRTPDYAMSALQDYTPGALAAQVHPFQITFEDKVVLFFSCPKTAGEGGGLRPDYWSGNGALPRAFGERNVALLLFRHGDLGWMSHAFFERDRFDEVVERGPWVFARKKDAYVGLWSEHGYETGRTGQYAGRELICRADENAWVVEAGRRADWKTFEAFVSKLSTLQPKREDGQISYPSPSVGTLRMGWEGPITLNGQRAQTSKYPLLDSPFGRSEFGSGEMVICHGDEEEELFFNQS